MLYAAGLQRIYAQQWKLSFAQASSDAILTRKGTRSEMSSVRDRRKAELKERRRQATMAKESSDKAYVEGTESSFTLLEAVKTAATSQYASRLDYEPSWPGRKMVVDPIVAGLQAYIRATDVAADELAPEDMYLVAAAMEVTCDMSTAQSLGCRALCKLAAHLWEVGQTAEAPPDPYSEPDPNPESRLSLTHKSSKYQP